MRSILAVPYNRIWVITAVCWLLLPAPGRATVCASVISGSGYPQYGYPNLGTVGNGASTSPSISDDGRYVVFSSNASNLAGSSRPTPSRGWPA